MSFKWSGIYLFFWESHLYYNQSYQGWNYSKSFFCSFLNFKICLNYPIFIGFQNCIKSLETKCIVGYGGIWYLSINRTLYGTLYQVCKMTKITNNNHSWDDMKIAWQQINTMVWYKLPWSIYTSLIRPSPFNLMHWSAYIDSVSVFPIPWLSVDIPVL
jgi:hypothetical protein